MSNQTWIKASKLEHSEGDVLCGYSRVFGERKYFLIVGNKRIDLDHPDLGKQQRIVEEDVSFSPQSVAIVQKVLVKGSEKIHVMIFDLSGTVLTNTWLTPSGRSAGTSIKGSTLQGKSLLTCTDQGIVRERYGTTGVEDEKLFDATEPFVTHEAELQPFRGGIAVAHGPNIRLLKLT